MTSPIDKYNQRKTLSEKHKQLEIPVELIKIQDGYNKANLELQHNFNLCIFKKQKSLTILIAIITALCSFITGVVGVFIGYYLNTTPKQTQTETQSKISITQPQNTVSIQKVQEQSHATKTKQSAQGEASSKDLLKKP